MAEPADTARPPDRLPVPIRATAVQGAVDGSAAPPRLRDGAAHG